MSLEVFKDLFGYKTRSTYLCAGKIRGYVPSDFCIVMIFSENRNVKISAKVLRAREKYGTMKKIATIRGIL